MIIPPLQGKLEHTDFFIYGACDEKYFDEFGKSLINSIQRNSNDAIHLHLFNPREDQKKFCESTGVSFSYENVPLDLFQQAANNWDRKLTSAFDIDRYKRILKSMEKGNDNSIVERIQKTYFACARFIRLHELLHKPTNLISIDVDAIIRAKLPVLPNIPDLYIRKNKQFLAGGLYLTSNDNSFKFLTEYANKLKSSIEQDRLYWSLDQDLLDMIVPKYRYKELPMKYIDWEMKEDSYVWTAKGLRKNLKIFIDEQVKYK